MNETPEVIRARDHYEIDVGRYGDPRWPATIEVRLFRYDDIGQKLLGDSKIYRRTEQ